MKTHARTTAPLGELVAAAFDAAARFSPDPRVVSRLATLTVARYLRRPLASRFVAATAP
jgi:hypothetical protein